MNIETALGIAHRVYATQTTADGLPYMFHVMRVADAFRDDDRACIVALLRYAVRDGDLTLQDMIDNGATVEQAEALRAAVPEAGEDFDAWLERAKFNATAREVLAQTFIDKLRVYKGQTSVELERVAQALRKLDKKQTIYGG